MIILTIICLSFTTIFIQKNIDKNYNENNINYQNLDILKYIYAILIIKINEKKINYLAN